MTHLHCVLSEHPLASVQLRRDQGATPMEPKTAGNVRAIGRALAVLQVINRHRSVSMMEIAKLADLPYPTAFRIVETLVDEGLIEQERGRKHYRPTPMVQSLSAGYRPQDRLAAVARPHVVALTQQVAWPITLCSRVGLNMMIRDSTHLMTPLTMSLYHPGYTFPILESSSGRAYLAFCRPDECDAILQELDRANPGSALLNRDGIRPLLEAIRGQGFSTHDRTLSTAEPGKNSSISAPLFDQAALVGTITLVFFASAMPLDRAVAQFSDHLMETARAISADIAADRA